MKIINQRAGYGTPLEQLLRNFSACTCPLAAALAFCAVSASAATLTWDADSVTTGPQEGSANWSDANMWWNGTADQNWADANPAVFGIGSGTAGNYTVTN